MELKLFIMSRIIDSLNISSDKIFYPPKMKMEKKHGENYRFHMMAKPSGALCNIDCDYCFYLHKQDLLQQPKNPFMSNLVLDEYIRQYLEIHQGNEEVTFTWQGGEPTVMGLDFFQRIVDIQEKYKPKGVKINNDIQTNGLLLNEAWCEFIKKHNFFVGLSLDGDQKLHDTFRKTKQGKGTFNKVMEAVALLKKYKIQFNVLCVINCVNADYPLEVYRFIRDQIKPKMIQFLPAVEPTNYKQQAPILWKRETLPTYEQIQTKAIDEPFEADQHYISVSNWSVQPLQWGTFLNTIWDEWLAHDFGKVFIDCFENAISQALGAGAQKCTSAPVCGKALALENNGDVYPCDHFVYPQFKLGNILETHQADLAFSKKQMQFGYIKLSTLPEMCKSCEFLENCYGGCPKDRFLSTDDGQPGLNYLCKGLKLHYGKVMNDLDHIKGKLGRAI